MTATSLLPLYFLSGKSPVTNPKFPPALKPGHPLYEEAWEILNLYYFSWLRDVCRRLGVAENDLDDRVQDVLCRLARRISKFDYQGSKGRFRAYLKRMAKNCAINAWRKLDQDMLGHTVDPASLGLPDDSVEELAGTVRGGVEIEIEKAERDRVHPEALTAIQEMISDHRIQHVQRICPERKARAGSGAAVRGEAVHCLCQFVSHYQATPSDSPRRNRN